MRYFVCVLDLEGRGISEEVCRNYESLPRRRGLQFRWQSVNHMAVLTAWDDPFGAPLFAHDSGDGCAAVGAVRLDNRDDLLRLVGQGGTQASDIAIVRRIIALHGTRFIPELLGDFAFIVWRPSTRTAVAACDAFAVQRIYYAERDGLIAFASRAEALAKDEKYEVRYLAELVTQSNRSRDLSVYAGVHPIPRASFAEFTAGNHVALRSYWHPSDVATEPSWAKSQPEAAEACRLLLMDSIRLRMGGEGETWAQLSGGIDSSSVVSCVQWMAEQGQVASGLAGTVTFVDRQGTGTDEREYSKAVIDRWNVPNTAIVDPPTWYDAGYPLPHLDQPRGDLHVYPRDRRLCASVRSAGGRVLLTGIGGDQLFSGTMLFFADWVARGRLAEAAREMARRAATGRVSFWELAYRNAILPLLPRIVHSWLVHDQDQIPYMQWLDRDTMRGLGLERRRAVTTLGYGGRFGHKYHHAVVSTVARLEPHNHGGVIADSLDVRHPLLYRPLVEFALRLPPELVVRPHAHRWVFRQAMRDILPDKVRTRVGKPGTAEFLDWSLIAERMRLAPLLREPILADLHVVDPPKLRTAFNDALRHEHGAVEMCGPLLNTLAVEAWLQIRSGRWPSGGQHGS